MSFTDPFPLRKGVQSVFTSIFPPASNSMRTNSPALRHRNAAASERCGNRISWQPTDRGGCRATPGGGNSCLPCDEKPCVDEVSNSDQIFGRKLRQFSSGVDASVMSKSWLATKAISQ